MPRRKKTAVPLDVSKAKRIVEAILFSSDKPVDSKVLLSAIGGGDETRLEEIVKNLNDEYEAAGRAFVISRFPGGKYMMHLRPEYVTTVRRFVGKPLLSSGLLRTLSFIAYHQPVARSTVAAVRGNRAYRHVAELIERGLIEAEKKGRTYILRTTKLFADYLGVEDSVVQIRKKLHEALEASTPKAGEKTGTSS
ncbi:MAG: SMC-Scp complex subunit ScpB [Nitrososphaerota archaeon]